MKLPGLLLAALFTAVMAVGLLLLFFVAVDDAGGAGTVTSTNGEEQTIYAKALDDHGCDSGEWHFVINQIRGEVYAPAGITVTFGNGQVVAVPLEKFTGKVAHYTTTQNLDSVVTQATARIYASWDGQFNLSHGPCTTPTPTPTPTATPSPTPTPTGESTPTPTTVPSSTPTVTTPIFTPTETPTPTTPTVGPAPVATSVTQAPQPISLPDSGGAPACECDDGGVDPVVVVLLALLAVGLTVAIMLIANYLRK